LFSCSVVATDNPRVAHRFEAERVERAPHHIGISVLASQIIEDSATASMRLRRVRFKSVCDARVVGLHNGAGKQEAFLAGSDCKRYASRPLVSNACRSVPGERLVEQFDCRCFWALLGRQTRRIDRRSCRLRFVIGHVIGDLTSSLCEIVLSRTRAVAIQMRLPRRKANSCESSRASDAASGSSWGTLLFRLLRLLSTLPNHRVLLAGARFVDSCFPVTEGARGGPNRPEFSGGRCCRRLPTHGFLNLVEMYRRVRRHAAERRCPRGKQVLRGVRRPDVIRTPWRLRQIRAMARRRREARRRELRTPTIARMELLPAAPVQITRQGAHLPGAHRDNLVSITTPHRSSGRCDGLGTRCALSRWV